jgi:hypothetical protein
MVALGLRLGLIIYGLMALCQIFLYTFFYRRFYFSFRCGVGIGDLGLTPASAGVFLLLGFCIKELFNT